MTLHHKRELCSYCWNFTCSISSADLIRSLTGWGPNVCLLSLSRPGLKVPDRHWIPSTSENTKGSEMRVGILEGLGGKDVHCGSKLGYQKHPKTWLIGSLLNGSILGVHQPLLPLFQAGKMLKSPNSTSQDSSIAPPRCAQMWSNLLAISFHQLTDRMCFWYVKACATPQRRWTMHAPRRHILGISFGHHEGKCDHELEESRQNAATEKISMSIQHSAINAYWFLLKGVYVDL